MAVSNQKFLEQLSSINLLNASELDTIREKLDEKQLQADAERLAKELVKAGKLTRYQAAALYQGRGKGLVCGEYVVLDKIGAGGMGQVFKAQHRRMKRLAAIKILPPHLMKDPQIIKRFYQEVEMAARLNHPHIVQAYDAAESGGLHFLVMEYIDGDDLASILAKRGPLTIEQAMHCLRQVAEGLAYAHGQGIIHRDIKPANLLVDRQGNVKILDMGLARMADALHSGDAHAAEGLTQEGQVMGTVDYMAPEQARDAHSVDHRADLYSLGCTLYRLVTGEVPFPADKLVKKLLAHATEPIPSLRKVRPNVPVRLEQLYERMMAKDPAERIASAREVADTLHACLSGVAEEQSSVSVLDDPADSQDWQSYIRSTAAGFSTLSRIRRNEPAVAKKSQDQPQAHQPAAARKNPLPIPLPYAVGGGVAILLLLLVGGWWAWRSRGNESPETPQVAQTFETLQKPAAVTPTSKATSSEPSFPLLPSQPPATDKPAATTKPKSNATPPNQATASVPLPATKPFPSGRAIDLLPLLDLKRDVVAGSWELPAPGVLRINAESGSEAPLLQIPLEVPASYTLTVVVKRIEGSGNFQIGILAGGKQANVGLGGKGFGIGLIDGKTGDKNETTVKKSDVPQFMPERPLELRYAVVNGGIMVQVDGRPLVDWKGPYDRLSLATNIKVTNSRCIYLGSTNNSATSFEISKLELTPLDGSNPQPLATALPTPPASTTTPAVPANTTPPAATHAPQTLIVGTEKDQLPDLKTAFQRAGPGDTILIRHRGPLEFTAVDLTGKTPLTIAGDSQDGVDFWPLLRQAPGTPDSQPALFHGDKLLLRLKKLHLGVAGPVKGSVGAVFALSEGHIELQQCTVTVGAQGTPAETIGEPIPLVRSTARSSGKIVLKLEQSFLRGPRLARCVMAAGGGEIQITANRCLWAGDSGPWLSVQDPQGKLTVALDRCTLYNLTSFLTYVPASGGVQSAVSIEANKTLLVGCFANGEPLIGWNATDAQRDLSKSVADGQFAWKGDANVYARFAGYYHEAKNKAAAPLTKWRTLLGQAAATAHRESDPMFRVWPTRYLLQEVTTFDLQPRFERNAKPKQIADADIGAAEADLPPTLIGLFKRAIVTAQQAGLPRGTPRILRVHAKEGPYQTIESALDDVRDEDIVEIADSATYTPRRNFSAAPASAVLVSSGDYLTIRAALHASPTVILSDSVHQGKLPTYPGGVAGVVLIEARQRAYLNLDGLHVRVNVSPQNGRTITFADKLAFFRATNCTFIFRPGRDANVLDGLRVEAHAFATEALLVWLENNVYVSAENVSLFVRLGKQRGRHPSDQCWLVRNCLFNGAPGLAIGSTGTHQNDYFRACLNLEANSFLNGVGTFYIRNPAIVCVDNLSISLDRPFDVHSGTPDETRKAVALTVGKNNTQWMAKLPADEYQRSLARTLLPGTLLSAAPIPEATVPSRTDPYRQYRLKKGQPAAAMATDGGPVGVRFEYLPSLPAEP